MAGTSAGANLGAARRLGIDPADWDAHRAAGDLWCYRCRGWRRCTEFGVDRSRVSGRASVCDQCRADKGRAHRYGLTLEQLDLLYLEWHAQGCPICGRHGVKAELDHDHRSGRVRGFLCSRCNGALGQFCDDTDLLREAIDYLERHDGR